MIDDIETASQNCCRPLNLGECPEWIDGLDSGETRADRCTTHHNACDCREAARDAEIAAPRARVATLEAEAISGDDRLSHDIALLRTRVATLEAECPSGHVKMPHGDVVRVLGRFWETRDGVIVARPDCVVYVCEGTDGYTRWSGKVVPMLFQNWLNKTDSEWAGNPSVGTKSQCPDGGWYCWSTREACEAAIAARAATGPIGGVA